MEATVNVELRRIKRSKDGAISIRLTNRPTKMSRLRASTLAINATVERGLNLEPVFVHRGLSLILVYPANEDFKVVRMCRHLDR